MFQIELPSSHVMAIMLEHSEKVGQGHERVGVTTKTQTNLGAVLRGAVSHKKAQTRVIKTVR